MSNTDYKLIAAFKLSSTLLSSLVAVAGAAFLVLWIIRFQPVAGWLPTPDFALVLLLLGICIRSTLVAHLPEKTRGWNRIAETVFYALPAGVLGLAIFALREIGIPRNVATNAFLMNSFLAANILILSAAVICLRFQRQDVFHAGQTLSIASLIASLFASIAAAFAGSVDHASVGFTLMPPPIALPLLALSLAALIAQPQRLLSGILISSGTGGKLTRRFLLFTTVSMIALSAAVLSGQQHGYYGLSLMLSIMAIACIAIFSAIFLYGGRILDHIEHIQMTARDALEQNIRQTRDVFRAVREAIVYADPQGQITAWNTQAQKMLGWNEDEIVNRNLMDTIVPGDDRPFFENMFSSQFAAADDAPATFAAAVETKLIHQDGHEIPVELSMSPIESNEARSICLVFRDISERIRLSNQLSLARDQAMESSRMKSEFVANMSHEIRTPLNAIVGMSDLLMGKQLAGTAQEFAVNIHDAAEVLLEIVNDILDYSKIEAGKMEMDQAELDVVSLVEVATDLVAGKGREKGLSLSSYVSSEIPRSLFGDPGRIRQVLLNLLTNAVKFTESGEVVVRAMPVEDSANSVTVEFSVTDTGVGISPEGLESIFEPFTQVDGSSSRRYGGTGLGLSICKRLVEMMHGTITVESAAGKGSRFSFTIPLGKPLRRPQIHPTKRVFEDVKLLIVDGPPTSSAILANYAASWGIKCDSVKTGEEALQMLRKAAAGKAPYDIAIVDFTLTHSDALALARSKQRYADLAHTKLVLTSNFDDARLAQDAMESGYAAVLTKPVKQSRLYECIVSLLLQQPEGVELTGEMPSSSAESAIVAAGAKATDVSKPVLLVEDNAVNQKVATAQLAQLGFTCHTAGNGEESLEALSKTDYALVLMDCQMPLMDGFEATKAIRKREMLTGKHIPIIAMTAHALAEDKYKCLSAGMDDYISKPVKINALKQMFDRHLRSADLRIIAPATTSDAVSESTAHPVTPSTP
jgi:PAS domain S-box-containing protein